MDNYRSGPRSDEIEISVFGPGYGECILFHLGSNNWAIIDSCMLSDRGDPAPIAYLRDLGIDYTKAVSLVIVTHWHDDHIRGIATVIDRCQKAEVVLSAALESRDFLRLAKLHELNPLPLPFGLEEFIRILRISESGRKFKFAIADRLLLSGSDPGTDVPLSVFSLSPSDAATMRAKKLFLELFPQANQRKDALLAPSTNETAVVVWVGIGDTHVLLGADLEEIADPDRGWRAIVSKSTLGLSNASVLKVPHHGSRSSHNAQVWNRLLIPEPTSVVTPFTRGANPLPTPDDVERIKGLSGKVYITSMPQSRKAVFQSRVVAEFVKSATRSFQPLKRGRGHVRLRRSILAPNRDWNVELFGGAYQA